MALFLARCSLCRRIRALFTRWRCSSRAARRADGFARCSPDGAVPRALLVAPIESRVVHQMALFLARCSSCQLSRALFTRWRCSLRAARCANGFARCSPDGAVYYALLVVRTDSRVVRQMAPCMKCGLHKYLEGSQMWLSSGGTTSSLHSHADHNLHCVLAGRKDFIVIEPQHRSKVAFQATVRAQWQQARGHC